MTIITQRDHVHPVKKKRDSFACTLIGIVLVVFAGGFGAIDSICELLQTMFRDQQGDPYWGFHSWFLVMITSYLLLFIIRGEKTSETVWNIIFLTLAVALFYNMYLLYVYWGTGTLTVWHWWSPLAGIGMILLHFFYFPEGGIEDNYW